MVALAGALAAAAEAGRYAGGGMRTMGRRVARSDFSRRTQAAARESRRRANLAAQTLRGLEPPPPPRPPRRTTYLAVGVLVGTTGAIVAEAVRRVVANGGVSAVSERIRTRRAGKAETPDTPEAATEVTRAG
jgi:hypothetical protein